MFRFTIRHSPDESPSIWSPEYISDAQVSLKKAAATFPGGEAAFVKWAKDRCSITQDESIQHHLGVDDVWRKLNEAFIILSPVIYNEMVMRGFLRQLFKTVVDDGVNWIEVRIATVSFRA